MTQIEITATVAGSRPMKAYGGVQIGYGVLEQLVEALRSGRLPMILNHDPTRPLHAEILDAGVDKDEDGYDQVWVCFKVDEELWRAVEGEWRAAGASGGFSFSGSEPIGVIAGDSPASRPTVALAADAHYWTDDDIRQAGERLRGDATVHIARRFAFARAPDPVVVITLYELAKNIAANALWDALKIFFRRRGTSAVEQTTFEFRVAEGDREVIGRLSTKDEAVLYRAISALETLADAASPVATWDQKRPVGSAAGVASSAC